ncbi:MAG: ligand-binding sensor domain-containing protein, partial [Pseudohongiellaceae bacterium]
MKHRSLDRAVRAACAFFTGAPDELTEPFRRWIPAFVVRVRWAKGAGLQCWLIRLSLKSLRAHGAPAQPPNRLGFGLTCVVMSPVRRRQFSLWIWPPAGRPCLLSLGAALACLGLVLVLAPKLPAQTYQVQRFTETEGLPSTGLRSIAQDPDGVLWLTTRAGLVSFDGHRFEEFPQQTLAQSPVRLLIDEQGVQYCVPTDLGREFLVGLPGQQRSIATPLAWKEGAEVLRALLWPRPTGTELAIATKQDGVWLWSEALGWRVFTEGLPEQLWAMDATSDELYVGGDQGIARLNGDSWQPLGVTLPGGVLGLSLDQLDGELRVWCMGDDWLGVIDGGRYEHFLNLPDFGFADRALREKLGLLTMPDGVGGLWFGGSGSLVRYDGRAKALRAPFRLFGGGGQGATALFRDRDSNVWVANERGLVRIPSLRFENWQASHGLLENEVTALLQRNPGQLLLGHNNGVSMIENG